MNTFKIHKDELAKDPNKLRKALHLKVIVSVGFNEKTKELTYVLKDLQEVMKGQINVPTERTPTEDNSTEEDA